MRILILATFAGVALLVGACGNAKLVDKVSQMKPKEDGFKANLHQAYIKLAKAELKEFDIFDTGVFARRAESAAMGKNFGPDRLWDRHYGKKNLALLTKERGRLVKALDAGGRVKQPVLAARAQTQFDCWAQELEENYQPTDIQRCRIGYLDAMHEMANAMKPAPKRKVAMKTKMKEKMKGASLTYVTPYVVYFDFDSTNFSGMASVRTLTQAMKTARKNKSTRIEVIGHTDSSGAANYNQKLSERRAIFVDQALAALGVNALIIEPSGKGQNDLEVKTEDGVRKAANRRVVIVVY